MNKVICQLIELVWLSQDTFNTASDYDSLGTETAASASSQVEIFHNRMWYDPYQSADFLI